MLDPEPHTAVLQPVSAYPDDTVVVQPVRADATAVPPRPVGDRDPMDAWYALVGRRGGSEAIAS